MNAPQGRVFFSENGKDWQSWNIFTTEGSLHKVESRGDSWIVGVVHENTYSIWEIGEYQFDHIIDLRLLDVVNNMMLAIDDSRWLYCSHDGIAWEKIHKVPSHTSIHSVLIEEKTVFEGVQ